MAAERNFDASRGVAYPAHVERHRTRARCDHSNAYEMRNPSKKAPAHPAAVVVTPVRGHVPPQPMEAPGAGHPRHGATQLAARRRVWRCRQLACSGAACRRPSQQPPGLPLTLNWPQTKFATLPHRASECWKDCDYVLLCASAGAHRVGRVVATHGVNDGSACHYETFEIRP